VNGRFDYVLDSTALIALIAQEPGYEKVQDVLDNSTISSVNLTEVIHKLVQKGTNLRIVERLLKELQLNVIDWSEVLAYRSAGFATFGKSHGLSLGDRACLTLARQLQAAAVTADRAWRQVPELGVELFVFR
jgi:ribonuclease VapC